MQRFRFTFLAVCLLLLFLGASDLLVLFRNPAPRLVSIADLQQGEPPAAWLTVQGGLLDLTEAINMSGSIDIEAFLIPLKQGRNDQLPRVIVETRDPDIIATLTTYYFNLDSEAARQQYLDRNQGLFYLNGDITGMLAGGLVASRNRDNLVSLAKELGMNVPDDVIFLSEGKTPVRWRGYFFSAIGLIGLIRLLLSSRRKARS